jgi:hypothetical protein
MAVSPSNQQTLKGLSDALAASRVNGVIFDQFVPRIKLEAELSPYSVTSQNREVYLDATQ